MNEKIEKLLDDFARANIRLMQGSFDMDAVDNARAAILAEIDRLTAEKEKAGAKLRLMLDRQSRHNKLCRLIARGDEVKGAIYTIDHKTATDFLLPRHYSGRKPQITRAWGWYDCQSKDDVLPDVTHLKAVCTIGKPASPPLCVGICGEENSQYVYELNRLCRVDDWNEPLSQFVGAILRQCRINNWIVVSFSDTDMHHNGYIYQACNFMYTGVTKERTDKYTEGNKHCRHYDNEKQGEFRKVRTAKHRYVYFCTIDKRMKKRWMNALNYPVQPYPKGENENYTLGVFQEPKLVRCLTNAST